MRLKLLTPTEVLFDGPVEKVVAEAANGSFCLLPRHVDFLAGIVPGLLMFETEEGGERFAAIDEGLLVKRDDAVLVSVRRAVLGSNLGQIRDTVREQFQLLDDRERDSHAALAKLEASFLRGYLDFAGESR